ncbi:MAG: HAMP domain-containing histidine kinase [Treponema sp.]|nr:HAMP domain-containing histidine kinase [Treponema sp.]
MPITKSVSFNLSIKFSLILFVAVLSIIFSFFIFFINQANKSNSRWLEKSADKITNIIINSDENKIETELEKIPIFIIYSIYDNNTKKILYSNNEKTTLLPKTFGEVKRTHVKDFSSDSNLNIIYITKDISKKEKNLTIQISKTIEYNFSKGPFSGLPKTITMAAIPILIMSFLISLFITKYTMLPVVKMTNSAKSIGSTNLDNLLPIRGTNDELDKLAQTFNELFCRLKNDFDRERIFSSNVSHELKTPIAVILGQANLLRRWGKDDPIQLEKSINTIIAETKTMENIVSNLLQLSKLETGLIAPKMSLINLKETCNQLSDEIKTISKNVILEFSNIDLWIKTDYELLHQVFLIVISNSIKFVKNNPIIKIEYRMEDSTCFIEISDNGNGFSEKIIPHVFERFFRGDDAHVRSVGGSGLGLSIAKSIITALNGNISASNTKEHGALITITLRS